VYRTADGHFLALSMLEGDRYWPGFCIAVDRPELIVDERFADADARLANSEACVEVLDAIFARYPLDEWKRILGSQEGPWSVMQTPRAALDDPQALANDYVQWVKYDNGATLPLVTAPAQIDGTPAALRAAPGHGTETDEILVEAGLTWDDLIRLKVSGAIT
jgi:crotonobetainyl-CoA:carnitine CoA-transferase CaiB-like acyl-CoA transferase